MLCVRSRGYAIADGVGREQATAMRGERETSVWPRPHTAFGADAEECAGTIDKKGNTGNPFVSHHAGHGNPFVSPQVPLGHASLLWLLQILHKKETLLLHPCLIPLWTCSHLLFTFLSQLTLFGTPFESNSFSPTLPFPSIPVVVSQLCISATLVP